MPQLPSGQKVGLANYRIIAMGENPFDYLEDIVKIGQLADVYRFIPIIQHVETDESDFERGTFDSRSTNTHQLDGLKPVAFTDLDPNQDEDEKYRRAASYIKAVRMLPARKD